MPPLTASAPAQQDADHQPASRRGPEGLPRIAPDKAVSGVCVIEGARLHGTAGVVEPGDGFVERTLDVAARHRLFPRCRLGGIGDQAFRAGHGGFEFVHEKPPDSEEKESGARPPRACRA